MRLLRAILPWYGLPFVLVVVFGLGLSAILNSRELSEWDWALVWENPCFILNFSFAMILAYFNILFFQQVKRRMISAIVRHMKQERIEAARFTARRLLAWNWLFYWARQLLVVEDFLAFGASQAGNYALAETYHQQSLSVGSGQWGKRHQCEICNDYAGTLVQMKRYDEAETYIRRAIELAKNGHEGSFSAVNLQLHLASILIYQSRLEEAQHLLEEYQQSREFSIPLYRHAWISVHSQYLESQGEWEVAMEETDRALAFFSKDELQASEVKELEERRTRLEARLREEGH